MAKNRTTMTDEFEAFAKIIFEGAGPVQMRDLKLTFFAGAQMAVRRLETCLVEDDKDGWTALQYEIDTTCASFFFEEDEIRH